MREATGYSPHWFQILAGTMVPGIIFAASVDNNLKTPEFSTNVPALMGRSAGTPIGLKFPEK